MIILKRLQIGWGIARSWLRGWRTRRHIVVIESDDWGSIRTSTRRDYDRLVALGYAMDRSPYSADVLETADDLDRLLEVLDSVRDRRGRPACLTANMIMANPDFERVRRADFREYFYEPLGATLARDPERRGVPERYADGFRRRLFVPQLHGREHIRWWEWIEALRSGSKEARLTFEMGMCGVPLAASPEGRSFFYPPYVDDETLARSGADLDAMVREGFSLFERQFGFRPLSTMAPGYWWTDRVERLWSDLGVRYVQGALVHTEPTPEGARLRPHFMGEPRATGGVYLIRNGYEPPMGWTEGPEPCLRRVARAFRFRQPAVIEAHRMNFVGSIRPEVRTRGLHFLASLLQSILSEWPDTLFLSSPELGCLMEHGDDLDVLDRGGAWPGSPDCGGEPRRQLLPHEPFPAREALRGATAWLT